jgi:hypothetical protein
MKKIIIILILLVLISCHRERNIINIQETNAITELTKNEYLENKEKIQDIIIENLETFIPTHVLLKNANVLEMYNERSNILIRQLQGDFVELILTETIEDIIWYKIRTKSNIIGWCRAELFLDITNIDLSKISMNNMTLSNIIIIDQNMENAIIEISENHGRFIHKYEMNLLVIEYFNRNYDFGDGIEMSYFRGSTRNALLYDILKYLNLDDFPSYGWPSTNIRRNNINGINIMDSFWFLETASEQTGGFLGLQRLILSSTNNYFLRIHFQCDDSVIGQIIAETPHYFLTTVWGNHVWELNNNEIEMFGNDLINMRHMAPTAVNWFNETEKILNNIRFE